MPSTRRSRRQPEQKPVFFVNRSLGRLEIAAALRNLGYETHTLWEIYGPEVEQTLDDEIWIRDSAAAPWLCLTRDYLRLTRLREAVRDCEAKIFRIEQRAYNADLQIQWLQTNINRIVQRGRRRGGWIDVVRETKVERYWP